MFLVASAYSVARAALADADYPVIGWVNYVTTATLTADEEGASDPASNLCNPSTAEIWASGSTADQYLTVLFGETITGLDYVAFARHNFGSGDVQLTVEGLPVGGDPDTPGDWDELYAAFTPADDAPLMITWEPADLIGVRVFLEPGATEPQAAIMYAGTTTVMERSTQPGALPLSRARQRTIAGPLSQSGEFLGRAVTGGKLATSHAFKAITPAWYRSTLEPLLLASAETPFFYTWKPTSYPAEIAFAWLNGEPQASWHDLDERYDVTLPLEGLIL